MGAAVPWDSSSRKASGWLVGLFSFRYWTGGGQLKKNTLYLSLKCIQSRGLITLFSGCGQEHGLCDQSIGEGCQLYGAGEDHRGWNLKRGKYMIKPPENKRWWISLRRLLKTSMCTQAWWRVLWLELLPPPLQLARFLIGKIHVKPTFKILGWWPDQASGRGEWAGGCWSACLSWSSHSFSWRGNSFHGGWEKNHSRMISQTIAYLLIRCRMIHSAEGLLLSENELCPPSLAKLSRH